MIENERWLQWKIASARSDKCEQNHEQRSKNKYHSNIESMRNYSWNYQKIKHYQNIDCEIMKYH